jgi:hypothetical protein
MKQGEVCPRGLEMPAAGDGLSGAVGCLGGASSQGRDSPGCQRDRAQAREGGGAGALSLQRNRLCVPDAQPPVVFETLNNSTKNAPFSLCPQKAVQTHGSL